MNGKKQIIHHHYQDLVPRTLYQQDLGTVNGTIEGLRQQLADQDAIIGEMLLKERRLLYRANLTRLVQDEGIDLSHEDIDQEVERIQLDTPEDYSSRRESEFRKHYKRTVVAQPRVGVGEARIPGAEPALTDAERRRASGLAYRKQCSFSEALAAIRKGEV